MQALVRTAPATPLSLQTYPTPTPTPGSVVVKVLHAASDYLHDKSSVFTHPFPSIPGALAIGRVAATGPDTTSLSVGQLIMLEPSVRARDNEDVRILWGVFDGGSESSRGFVERNWKDGMLAEYVKAPLENCWALNETVLCGELGYKTAELLALTRFPVPYGGFRSVGLSAGETVVVAPATGTFSGAAVGVAVAMGARIVAAGRNLKALERLREIHGGDRVKIVQLTGETVKDTAAVKEAAGGWVDVFMDFSPPQATGATSMRSGMMALRPYGRAVLAGFVFDDNLAVPYAHAVFKNITIRGQYMYEREDVKGLLKLAESGMLKVGKNGGEENIEEFRLDEHEKAEMALANSEPGKIVVISP
ncbi:hypothetical protein AJ79_09757 [Helicocarpus griseus UAMH5409]|uniref:Alcohol dehydrogenase-like C-terminal domain-containing protein n=1 Tax=Helicocarpus griseus UAMH5409 TaxID=1447875 RepID=A0A2B7WHH7_9EURO|nr:hypothetical protein AJ79_09757 [Helicocarpus griseus UAMH5409]